VIDNPWIPHLPTPRQARFLTIPSREAFYGGAAGGGKSDALLMAALQYVTVPGYSAIIFRKTYADLSLPGALMDRAADWLQGKAHWSDKTKTWTFPSGATVSFGYMEHEKDKFRYKGAEYQFVGFDELTQFTETQYRFMFSRLRRLTGATVPIRMRGASNPGDTGHEWVKKRFVKPGRKGVPFIPARIRDNPHLDFADYVQSLNELDPITRRQMLAGDWDAFAGGRFLKEWFGEFRIECDERRKIYWYILGNGEHIECQQCWNFCTVDPASRAEEINDYTVISTFAVTPRKDILWLDAVRERIALDKICHRIAEVCQDWEPAWVGIEDVGFQLGILNEARRHPNIPAVRGLKPKGTGKLARATPAINRAEQGQIWIPAQMRMDNGDEAFPWIEDCIGELVQFTGDDEVDAHDDVVDTLSYAIQELDCLGLAAPIVVNPENYEDTQRDKPNSIFSRR